MKKIIIDKLSPEIILEYERDENNTILVPKTVRDALDMLDCLYELRCSTHLLRLSILDIDTFIKCSATLLSIESDIRHYLNKCVK